MNHRPIYISHDDNAKLRLLLSVASYSNRNSSLAMLRQELDRAIVVDASAIDPAIVTMNSSVQLEDVATGEIDEYTLTFPERANVEQRLLSVLAPIGTAILGYREGDEVSWTTPGGVRQIRIRRVTPPAVAAAAQPQLAAVR